MKAGLDSSAVRKKIEEDEQNADFSSNPMARGNQDFVANQQLTTKKMIDQQVRTCVFACLRNEVVRLCDTRAWLRLLVLNW